MTTDQIKEGIDSGLIDLAELDETVSIEALLAARRRVRLYVEVGLARRLLRDVVMRVGTFLGKAYAGDLDTRDEGGCTALMEASIKGHTAIVALLVEEGADVEAKNNYGFTALILASFYGHTAIVALLVKKGADKEAKNIDGYTALILASRYGHTAIVALLKAKGATS